MATLKQWGKRMLLAGGGLLVLNACDNSLEQTNKQTTNVEKFESNVVTGRGEKNHRSKKWY